LRQVQNLLDLVSRVQPSTHPRRLLACLLTLYPQRVEEVVDKPRVQSRERYFERRSLPWAKRQQASMQENNIRRRRTTHVAQLIPKTGVVVAPVRGRIAAPECGILGI
jgi:hypothetical protein